VHGEIPCRECVQAHLVHVVLKRMNEPMDPPCWERHIREVREDMFAKYGVTEL
jgi:hypothetical protein